MSFAGKKHSQETKDRIAASRKKYVGKKHPRYGAEWSDDQRAKYTLTMHQKKFEEQQIKSFLIKHDSEFRRFKQTTTI